MCTACPTICWVGHIRGKETTNSQAIHNGPSRPTRDRRAPSHLDDYFCYNARVNDPSLASSPSINSSSNPYPLVNYITCDNFSVSHNAFLATITKIIEPRYYHEAVKDPRWCQAMAEEIKGLKDNMT